jgi:hypothetical protein
MVAAPVEVASITIGRELKRMSSPDCEASRLMFAMTKLLAPGATVVEAGVEAAETTSDPPWSVMVDKVMTVEGKTTVEPEVWPCGLPHCVLGLVESWIVAPFKAFGSVSPLTV